MLDKRTLRFLSIISRICDDGSYKIIEKAELAKEMVRGTEPAVLNQMVRFLSDNEMIDVKYTDETVFCLTVLPKGRVAVESTRRKARDLIRIDRRTLLILFGGCFVASLFGAMLGCLFFSLF